MTGGSFEQNHLLGEALSDEAATTRWTERWARDKKHSKRARPVPNTVTSEADFQAALDAGSVTGAYPKGREDRAGIKVAVAAKTVWPDGNNAGEVTDSAQVGVAGSGTDSLYFPDHYVS